jgi:hypothetical protein
MSQDKAALNRDTKSQLLKAVVDFSNTLNIRS